MHSVFHLISNTRDGVCAVDRGQRIVLWNAAACGILGLTPDEVIGKRCFAVLGAAGLCGSDCKAFHAARRGELTPTRRVHVETARGNQACLSVTTIVLPESLHQLAVLAHLFRESSPLSEGEPISVPRPREGRSRTGNGDSLDPEANGELTPREVQVLQLLASGASTDAIMARLGIGRSTVRTHVQRILGKLAAHSRLEAVTTARSSGLL